MDTVKKWQIARYDYDRAYVEIETEERGPDVPDRGYPVAYVPAVDENDPTARLISAAPDMLDALRDAYTELNQLYFLSPSPLTKAARDKAADAIKKATE